jgi:hypothetical protein
MLTSYTSISGPLSDNATGYCDGVNIAQPDYQYAAVKQTFTSYNTVPQLVPNSWPPWEDVSFEANSILPSNPATRTNDNISTGQTSLENSRDNNIDTRSGANRSTFAERLGQQPAKADRQPALGTSRALHKLSTGSARKFSTSTKSSMKSKAKNKASQSQRKKRPGPITTSSTSTVDDSKNNHTDSSTNRKSGKKGDQIMHHNMVEKQYRNRLNGQFENLLNTLPAEMRKYKIEDTWGDGDHPLKRVSKIETLVMATNYIQGLEKKEETLVEQQKILQAKEQNLKELWQAKNGVVMQ